MVQHCIRATAALYYYHDTTIYYLVLLILGLTNITILVTFAIIFFQKTEQISHLSRYIVTIWIQLCISYLVSSEAEQRKSIISSTNSNFCVYLTHTLMHSLQNFLSLNKFLLTSSLRTLRSHSRSEANMASRLRSPTRVIPLQNRASTLCKELCIHRKFCKLFQSV